MITKRDGETKCLLTSEKKAQKLFNTYQQAMSEEAVAGALANPLFSWHATLL